MAKRHDHVDRFEMIIASTLLEAMVYSRPTDHDMSVCPLFCFEGALPSPLSHRRRGCCISPTHSIFSAPL